ncbi:MAG TPA: hypothetical protein VH413_12375 [Verrucomicrobiae bacterium]|jgi:hypothetical protein|nr:hypothetical protein [Verrucomicrobiae bacterium]
MNDKLDGILERIKQLEKELPDEARKKQQDFRYTVQDRKVRFHEGVQAAHERLVKKFTRYLYDSKPLTVLTTPMLLFCALPVVFIDLVAGVFQFVCFPVYGIPKVVRKDYVLMDRRKLAYLNWMEKWNCGYCEYVNGVLAYVQEVAGRTEQYWCPIKHALRVKSTHSRYSHFFEYGDAEQYRKRLESVRRDFDDLTHKEG